MRIVDTVEVIVVGIVVIIVVGIVVGTVVGMVVIIVVGIVVTIVVGIVVIIVLGIVVIIVVGNVVMMVVGIVVGTVVMIVVGGVKIIVVLGIDIIDNRLCCKYICNGIAVLKLFHVLALIYISPLYPDGVHRIAKELIQQLREILYDKRIIKMVVDTDGSGMNDKPHKTTRLKIYFAMNNSDRYCIRLDFPHIGEESIHLNMNEPGQKQSTGLPFSGELYEEACRICKNSDIFSKLFYYRDDLYWFRSGFATVLKDICRDNAEKGKELKEFYHNRAHVFWQRTVMMISSLP